jgi:hypothetical protein
MNYQIKRWIWLSWAMSMWAVPAAMLCTWWCCYTEVFGEPPCAPWAEWAMHVLFGLDFLIAIPFLFYSARNEWYLLFALLLVAAQIVATYQIWFWGGMSVSGFYL